MIWIILFSSSCLNSIVWHPNAIYSRSLNVLATTSKKRNIEESNIEVHDDSGTIQSYSTPSTDFNYISAELEFDIDTERYL
jgi:hypothetical protein